ncbi:OmpA family protein [Actimicrobium sp. CCI2.3]|uniref:OmpA family protein n=1 Tax=Actimicrobium sp. CCI2.3 TaxID=3048616 RepID=UPI002AB35E01|nr:OmpA family protein [Actimicrobium sp. CCI2.3]MDY7574611.1 OmpA family protein [Actimicrobium sp. CCI2.3]MEB0023890.1 OmpA family protein [Actimicrobium sp. CCI2.3]
MMISTSCRGSTLIEFAVIGPILSLIGLALLQYGMLYFAKNHYNHANFMAARAGSMDHASLNTIEKAYAKALAPLYGGGTSEVAVAASADRALTDIRAHGQIELRNPTTESFDDFNVPALQQHVGNGKRVIPNSGQQARSSAVGARSGQSIQDANLLKLRITTGYRPQVPLVGALYTGYLTWQDDGTNMRRTAMLRDGRIPITTEATVQMQSDAIEDNNISVPGAGDGGNSGGNSGDTGQGSNPDNPASGNGHPADCANPPCNLPAPDTPRPTEPGGLCTGDVCPACPDPVPLTVVVPGDITFSFGQATLTEAGKTQLDLLIAAANAGGFASVNVDGYTDQIGSQKINLALSTARAATIRDYLLGHGLSGMPVRATGHGATNLKVQLAQCAGTSGTAQQTCLAPNRRVEVTLNP